MLTKLSTGRVLVNARIISVTIGIGDDPNPRSRTRLTPGVRILYQSSGNGANSGLFPKHVDWARNDGVRISSTLALYLLYELVGLGGVEPTVRPNTAAHVDSEGPDFLDGVFHVVGLESPG